MRCPAAAWPARRRKAAGQRPAAADTRSRPVGLPRTTPQAAAPPPAPASDAPGPAQGAARSDQRGVAVWEGRARQRTPLALGSSPPALARGAHLPLGGAAHAEARARHTAHLWGSGRAAPAEARVGAGGGRAGRGSGAAKSLGRGYRTRGDCGSRPIGALRAASRRPPHRRTAPSRSCAHRAADTLIAVSTRSVSLALNSLKYAQGSEIHGLGGGGGRLAGPNLMHCLGTVRLPRWCRRAALGPRSFRCMQACSCCLIQLRPPAGRQQPQAAEPSAELRAAAGRRSPPAAPRVAPAAVPQRRRPPALPARPPGPPSARAAGAAGLPAGSAHARP